MGAGGDFKSRRPILERDENDHFSPRLRRCKRGKIAFLLPIGTNGTFSDRWSAVCFSRGKPIATVSAEGNCLFAARIRACGQDSTPDA
jgi:hypothetical protein